MTQCVRLGACSTLGRQGVGLHRVTAKHGSGRCWRSVGWMRKTHRNSGMSWRPSSSSAGSEVESRTEVFLKELEEEGEDNEVLEMRSAVDALTEEACELQHDIDDAYKSMFSGRTVVFDEEENREPFALEDVDEALFTTLGKDDPTVMSKLVRDVTKEDADLWQKYQSKIQKLKLQWTRVQSKLETMQSTLADAERKAAMESIVHASQDDDDEFAEGDEIKVIPGEIRMVMITGFESFNSNLYSKIAQRVSKRVPNAQISVFDDRAIKGDSENLNRAIDAADVVFASLIVDYDDALWLRSRIEKVPLRFIFESALELMSMTQIGTFSMASNQPEKKSSGAPPIVKKVLSLFGSGREEDRLLGYMSFLKIGPKLLKFIPGTRARDIKNWLTVYSYWNEGGLENVTNMYMYIIDKYFGSTGLPEATLLETPQTGCVHPQYDGYFNSPAEYLSWYEKNGPIKTRNSPTVGMMVYRKHVITGAGYVNQLITLIEEQGLKPVPIFINGVEAHTIVRDQMTTNWEQKIVAQGKGDNPTLRKDAIKVDAIINTIGFPLVGGPAGSVEAGRQTDISKSILKTKNVPYMVASPLLVQNLESWMRDGIAGLQSVVLYSLPELDGAIDTVPLGGLVGDNIYLVPERVEKMCQRLKKWIKLKNSPASEKKIAVLLYGFPPGVGATGTAALLNVPRSLASLLKALREEGYDLGDSADDIDGDVLIEALKAQEGQRTIAKGAKGIQEVGGALLEASGVKSVGAEVNPRKLKEMLTYPEEWGPNQWGPIPFLPSNDILVQRLQSQWGDLYSYRGISTTAKGEYLVPGLQLGNVWIGVQPLLGLEGDPMRLLFERDLTPHPQYASFYKWLEQDFQADAIVHFGMHGTVEWLPGSPLGNTGFSWSDVLLGGMPNVYVYACNNPSESIIAKRRGYGTIVSHNVPPYGRAGLYKQLTEVRSLVAEYREKPQEELKAPIIRAMDSAGLQDDCPFVHSQAAETAIQLDEDTVADVADDEFLDYMGQVNQYLQVLENRLFSEGLHTLGCPPDNTQLSKYLKAYFGDDVPDRVIQELSILPQNAPFDLDSFSRSVGLNGDAESLGPKIQEAKQIRDLLSQNSGEIGAIIKVLNGEYLEAAPGGDLLRDGAGVLPTGKNIHALDPYRMPGPAALARGTKVAEAILEKHLADNNGLYPETIAVNLWGLDAIKTKGESVAIVLHLVGAKSVQEGTGRVARYELVPLEELGGRPRVDVLCNMSGIFRDSFQNVVELLDDLFRRAADADEDPEMNYIKKHKMDMDSKGLENGSARLFSNPAGDYGSMVNERVGASDWENTAELGNTWASRNSFSYGRGGEKGTARPEVLQTLLKTTDRIVQEIDSVEYGLTDIQEYYANTGALKQAAETARDGKAVGASIVESFSKSVKPTELDDVLRIEYRTKLLNPKWAEAMVDQGSGGAYEISSRMTAMIGWGATTGFTDDWAWDQAAETYAFDPEMARKLKEANPQAFKNVVRRMIEASGRGFWKTDSETINKLQDLYTDIENELEGV